MRRLDSAIFCAIFLRSPITGTFFVVALGIGHAATGPGPARPVLADRRPDPRAGCGRPGHCRAHSAARCPGPRRACARRARPTASPGWRATAAGACRAGLTAPALRPGGRSRHSRGRLGASTGACGAAAGAAAAAAGAPRWRVRARLEVALAFDFQADQFTAHGHDLAHFAAQRDHAADHRRGNLTVALSVMTSASGWSSATIADLHMPGDQFDFRDAFADVGHLDDMNTHSLNPPSRA